MTMTNTTFETQCLSSLAKVFADEELRDKPFKRASALLNETYSFQVAYRSKVSHNNQLNIRVDGSLKNYVSVRAVGLAPSEFPIQPDHDGHVLRTTPGLYPDPLYPLKNNATKTYNNQWRSIWITVELDDKVQTGVHPITVLLETDSGEQLGEEIFELEVIPQVLPEQQFTVTNWFHTDCLATYYDDDVFSEAHWNRIEQFVDTAAKHGQNMLLTPLFTPPLDTEIGAERPTVQLVDVKKSGDSYQFEFDQLTRWINMATERGIKYFELSHLFTQWGANHAPKIVAEENGVTSKIFGWETDATGETYKHFLSQFLPALVTYIKQQGLEKIVYFHVSDEPNINHLDSYKQAAEIIDHYLSEFPVIDALSDYQFYEQGLVKKPIPSNDHIEPFLENNIDDLWTYYCVSQYKDVSNRFFCFPSARNRIIGAQFYKFNITGFLHWGYNFWYSQFSRKAIDPFQVTDADNSFPSGDAFIVYPGEDGPIESIRMEVFFEALQDLRALQLLEKLVGKEKVMAIVESRTEKPITFSDYPRDSEWLLEMRENVNNEIARNSKN